MTITLRTESASGATTKGSALSFQELDNNFIDLLNRSQEIISGNTGSETLGSSGTAQAELALTGAGANSVAVTADSAGKIVATITGNIQNESAPTLGADLSTNGNKIKNTSGNINLEFAPTTGALELDNGAGINLKGTAKVFTTTTNNDMTIQANGTGQIKLQSDQQWNSQSTVDANFSVLTNYVAGYNLLDIQSITPNGNFTIDPTAGNNYYIVPLGNSTFQGFPDPEVGQTVRAIIDGVTAGPGVTVTFDEFADATVLTSGGGSKVTSGAYDIVEILCLDAGDSTGNAVYVVNVVASNLQ
jgi:hypothetical protein